MASETVSNHQEKALALLQADAEKILRLIKVQMDHLTMPQCPLYEEVLDTQMFGLSRSRFCSSPWSYCRRTRESNVRRA